MKATITLCLPHKRISALPCVHMGLRPWYHLNTKDADMNADKNALLSCVVSTKVLAKCGVITEIHDEHHQVTNVTISKLFHQMNSRYEENSTSVMWYIYLDTCKQMNRRLQHDYEDYTSHWCIRVAFVSLENPVHILTISPPRRAFKRAISALNSRIILTFGS